MFWFVCLQYEYAFFVRTMHITKCFVHFVPGDIWRILDLNFCRLEDFCNSMKTFRLQCNILEHSCPEALNFKRFNFHLKRSVSVHFWYIWGISWFLHSGCFFLQFKRVHILGEAFSWKQSNIFINSLFFRNFSLITLETYCNVGTMLAIFASRRCAANILIQYAWHNNI